MIARIRQWLREKWCDWFHYSDHIKLPLYKQGTYEVVGMALFCKRCIKEQGGGLQ